MLKFPHQIKLAILNVENKACITLVVVLVYVTTLRNKVFAFLLVNFECFLFWYFEISKFQFSSYHFRGLQLFCVKFHKGEEGLSFVLLVNFEDFLFWYFEVL
jgi:hypothetical protein